MEFGTNSRHRTTRSDRSALCHYKCTISSKHDVHKHNELSARTSVQALKQIEDCFNVFLCARDVKIKIFVFGDIWCLQRGNVRTEYLIIIDNIMEWNLSSVIRAIQIYPGDDDDNDNEIMKSVFFCTNQQSWHNNQAPSHCSTKVDLSLFRIYYQMFE